MSSSNKNSPPSPASRTTVAVVGVIILLALAWSPISGAIAIAHRAAAAANLHGIANLYVTHTHPNGQAQSLNAGSGDSTYSLAQLFARADQFNDATPWFIPSDPQLAGSSIPNSVMDAQTGQVNSSFANLPLAYEFVANINPAVQPFNTPIGWTRGLRDDGTWAPDSPWQGQGGHIAYLDGHVTWHDRLTTSGNEVLLKYGTNIPTVNIREALPPGAVVLSAEPKK
jgi:prepilin-type processing-associated H-X9-DG protein